MAADITRDCVRKKGLCGSVSSGLVPLPKLQWPPPLRDRLIGRTPHSGCGSRGSSPCPAVSPRRPGARRESSIVEHSETPFGSTRERVAILLDAGLSHAAIAGRLGVSKSTVSYHARRLGRPSNPRCARRYDWVEIQRYYDAGHSVADCQAHFGFAKQAWNSAVRRGAVLPRPQATPLSLLLAAGTPRGRWNIKRRLIASGLKQDRCEECGLTDWRGRPLSLDLHHRNGDRHDNRLENLSLLCPNCHSQTDSFAGRNRRAA